MDRTDKMEQTSYLGRWLLSERISSVDELSMFLSTVQTSIQASVQASIREQKDRQKDRSRTAVAICNTVAEKLRSGNFVAECNRMQQYCSIGLIGLTTFHNHYEKSKRYGLPFRKPSNKLFSRLVWSISTFALPRARKFPQRSIWCLPCRSCQ